MSAARTAKGASSVVRVVSLLPAGSDIVASLGMLDALVGVTHECDWPADVAGLPRVTASAVHEGDDPARVDAEVRALADAGADLFTLDEARIDALAPTVILTQALCDVCAVRESDVRALAARMAPAPEVITLSATTLDGVLDDVRRVATALGAPERGEALVDALQARMRRVHEALKAARAPRPRVAVIEWTDPIYAAGHWVPDLVRRAGGVDVLATAGEHSRPRTMAEIRNARPDWIVLAPCGYDRARAAAELARVQALDAWAWTRDVQCVAADATAHVSRPGPRLVDGVEWLAAVLNPDVVPMPS